MTGEKGGLLAGLRAEALKWPPSRSPCAGPDESGHTLAYLATKRFPDNS